MHNPRRSSYPAPSRSRGGLSFVSFIAGRALAALFIFLGMGALLVIGSANASEADTMLIGSVEQLAVVGARSGASVELVNAEGVVVAEGTVDEFGAHLFRDVAPGSGYTVTERMDGAATTFGPAAVTSRDDTPDPSLYEQTLAPGDGYFTVRDGTKLAYQLLLPDADEWGAGPHPVVIDYSGYEPSVSIYDGLDREFLARGYAVMGVNMRGTGCSGGAFDYFEWLQALDGYDMVEVVAAQSWADGVALVGKSYPGISQLFVAATRPPSLDAIVPGHVIADFYRDVVYPGGMQNVTYAVHFAERQEAIAAYPSGYGWVQERIAGGDAVCEANQSLRGQNLGLLDRLSETVYDEQFWMERAPYRFVDKIDVPTLLVNTWQDDTTGGRPAVLLERFADDVPVRFVGGNGDHGEYYGPAVLGDIERFLSYYVKGVVPEQDMDRFATFADAFAAYEAEDPIKIYWEIGSGGGRNPAFATTFDMWPPGDTLTMYFHEGGRLSTTEPIDAGEPTTYRYDPGSKPPLLDSKKGWQRPAEGTAATFVTDPLIQDTTFLGTGAVQLWLASTAVDTDVEVVLSEVRPDGEEMFVQVGWLRASHRQEDEELATPLRPYHTHRTEDVEPLRPGEFVPMRVGLFPFGHVFRAGSRIKVSVEVPGGNRARWAYGIIQDEADNAIAHTPTMTSRVLLPLVPHMSVPTGLAECGTVREQPCRTSD